MTLSKKLRDAVHRLATGSRRVRNLATPLGALVFASIICLLVSAARLVDAWLDLPGLLPGRWNVYISVPLLLAGSFMIGWSVLHFIRARGTPVPFNPPPRLVTDGPYARSRNPMLTGVFLALFGLGAALASISLVCIFTPLFIGLNVWELKTIEEPELAKRLGPDYLAYKQRTPMFMPGLRGQRRKKERE